LAFPKPERTHHPLHLVPCAKVWGEARGRKLAFRPESIAMVSAMSFGSLSENAIEAINRESVVAKGLRDTGEDGISPCHAKGGDLVYQLGTCCFGARTPDVPTGERPPPIMETPVGPSAVSVAPAPASAEASGPSSGGPTAPAAALRGRDLPFPSDVAMRFTLHQGWKRMRRDRIARPATARYAAGLRPGEQTFPPDVAMRFALYQGWKRMRRDRIARQATA